MTGPFTPVTPDSTLRFHVYEYICDGGQLVRQVEALGTRQIRVVLADRPDDCLYALLHIPGRPDHEVIVADLADLTMDATGLASLGRHWVFPSLDAARAGAVLHYGTL